MEEEETKAVSGEKVIVTRDDFTIVERLPRIMGMIPFVCLVYGSCVGKSCTTEAGAFACIVENKEFISQVHGAAWMEGGKRPKKLICDPDKLEIRAVF